MEQNMKRAKQMMLLSGLVCAMGIAVCACGGAKENMGVEESQEVISEPVSGEEGQNDAEEQDLAANDNENGAAEGAAEDNTAMEGNHTAAQTGGSQEGGAGNGNVAESGEKAQSSGENAMNAWPDGDPNLKGDIKEVKDGQLTVIEAITEEEEDGSSEIMVSPGIGGDDSGFNKVAVTYDENTLFAVETIYDGGARYDLTEATAADMSAGLFINVWGSYSGSSLEATRICIVKVDGVSG